MSETGVSGVGDEAMFYLLLLLGLASIILLAGAYALRQRPRLARSALFANLAVLVLHAMATYGDWNADGDDITAPVVIASTIWMVGQLAIVAVGISKIKVPKRQPKPRAGRRPPPPPTPLPPLPPPAPKVTPEPNRPPAGD